MKQENESLQEFFSREMVLNILSAIKKMKKNKAPNKDILGVIILLMAAANGDVDAKCKKTNRLFNQIQKRFADEVNSVVASEEQRKMLNN
jgi:hypothetical protein